MLEILKSLKKQTGKGSVERKMNIMMQHKDNKVFKAFFFWSLDPQFNYWQSKVTKNKTAKHLGDLTFLDAMGIVFDKLANREVTGNAAKSLLTEIYYRCDEDDAELLQRVITGKPDVGFSVSTINKVWEDLIYDPAYMRCKGYSPKMVETWDWKKDVIYSQIKADGMFLNIFLGDTLSIETRSGEDLSGVIRQLPQQIINTLSWIKKGLKRDFSVLHGEIVCWQDGVIMERSKSNGVINKVKQGSPFPNGIVPKISLWDQIPGENFLDHLPYEVPYTERFGALKYVVGEASEMVEIIEHKRVYDPMEAQFHFVRALQRGLEGTVLKNADKLFWANHDSPNQLKLKNKFRFEMRVTGFVEGKGKFKSTFGSMIVESEDVLLISAISGMSNAIREYINANRTLYVGSIIEMEANGLFKNDDGSYGIMHPRYKELRLDRTEADTLERIIQQEIDSILGQEMESEV